MSTRRLNGGYQGISCMPCIPTRRKMHEPPTHGLLADGQCLFKGCVEGAKCYPSIAVVCMSRLQLDSVPSEAKRRVSRVSLHTLHPSQQCARAASGWTMSTQRLNGGWQGIHCMPCIPPAQLRACICN
eukprot:1160253-Pelagomonas_calceolata.AAC.3